MPRQVAIIGVGQTKHASRRKDVNIPGLIYEAVSRAYQDANINQDAIEAVIFGSAPEHFEGVTLPEKYCVEASGAFLKPQMRIHTGGTVGGSTGLCAYYHVASGIYDLVMAICFQKLSEGITQYAISACYDPIFGRDFACGAPGNVAIQARRFMHRSKVTEEHAAMVAVKNRKNALKNPYAHLHINITVEDVLRSSPIATPLKLYDCCPTSDGACAVIFASYDLAKKLCPKPAWIKAVVSCTEAVNSFCTYPDREWGYPVGCIQAAKKAYSRAGISNPRKEIDVLEVYDAFSFQELLWYEALGICDEGESSRLIDSGATEMTGDIPVNPSGGVLSTNPIGASGLLRQAEAALQVMDKAGEHQIPNVKTALAHAWGGFNQFFTIMILSNIL